MGIQLLSLAALLFSGLALWRGALVLQPLRGADRTRWGLVVGLCAVLGAGSLALLLHTLSGAPGRSWEWVTAATLTCVAVCLTAVLELTRVTWSGPAPRQHASRDFQRLLEVSFDGVLRIDPEGRIVDLSLPSERLLGDDARTLRGRRVAGLFPDASRAALDDCLGRADGSRLAAQRPGPAGEVLELELFAVPAGDEGERWLALRDVTRRSSTDRERDRFFGLSVDMLCVAGFDGYFKQLNPAWTEVLGYSMDELLARPYEELVHPDDLDTTVLQATHLGDTGAATLAYENRFRHKDGGYRRLRWTACVSLEEQRIYGVARDVTQRQRAETRFRQVVELSPSGILIIDAAGRIALVNSKAETQFGYPRIELSGQPATRLLPAGVRFPAFEAEAIAGGTLPDGPVELSGQRKDGSRFPIEVSFRPIESEDGTSVLASIVDMTERVRSREQISRQIAILEATTDLVAYADADQRVRYLNRAGRALLGYAEDEPLEALTLRALHPEGVYRRFEEEIVPSVQATGRFLGELAVQNRDGDEIPVSALYLLHRSGDEPYLSTIMRDITEQKRNEEVLARARDAAVASARAKAQFLANMSHEIRTPLNAIIGMASLILDTQLNAQQEEFANTIRDSANVLLDLISEVLDFSKLEARKVELEHLDFELRPVLHEAVQLCASRALAKRLELSVLVPQIVPDQLRGDPARLRQVLLNLLTNAIKFTNAGEVVVEVELVAQSGLEVQLEVAVVDTGIGIAEDARSRMFRPFSQAEVSTTRNYGGSGLGLVISKRLLELMGGEIGFNSTPGEGSRFWFRVPFQRSVASTRATVLLHSERPVLVVEPHANTRTMLLQQLACLALEAIGCEGPDALARSLADTRPSAVLVAESVPGGGLACAGRLHREHGLRCVLLTSLDHAPSEAELSASGIAGCLRKPVRPNELRDCMVRLLQPVQHRDSGRILPTGGGPRRSVRILIAEDNSVNRKIATLQLKKLGYKADAVADGSEAVAAQARLRYDLVLMDCQMPVMDGYQATRAIRELGAHDVVIVAMTAYALEGDRERCLAAGMDDYLPKPIDVDRLRATLQRWCSPVDDSVLSQLATLDEDDPELFPSLVRQYLLDADERIERLHGALDSESYEPLRHTAHQLKGSSSQVGARFLSRFAGQLEEAAGAEDRERARELVAEVANEWNFVESALREVLERSGEHSA